MPAFALASVSPIFTLDRHVALNIITLDGDALRRRFATFSAGAVMYKYRFDNNLRLACIRSRRRSAFSLAELVVSVGILVLMLSLAGQVFNLTIQSTGQALALTNTSQILRAFEQTLREDLRHVQPGRSFMLIQGNPVNAYWSREGQETDDDGDPSNGYPHASDPSRETGKLSIAGNPILELPRADMLMLFTARRAATYSHARQYPDIASNLQQVVYGHAALGEYVINPVYTPGSEPYLFEPSAPAFPVDSGTGYPSPTTPSLVPAEGWHLARRNVLLVPTPTPLGTANVPLTLIPELSDLLMSKNDVIGNFSYEDLVVRPGTGAPWYLPGIIDLLNPIPRSQMDASPPPLYGNRLGHYFLPNCASFKVEWTLDPRSEFVAGRLDGMDELLWVDPGRFDASDPKEHPFAEVQQAIDEAIAGIDSATSDAERLRHERRRVRLESLLNTPTVQAERSHPDMDPNDLWFYSLKDRFVGNSGVGWVPLSLDGRPNLVAFGAHRRDPGPTANVADDLIVTEDIFPGALRITVDLYDNERRLERPIRHVMVIPVGR